MAVIARRQVTVSIPLVDVEVFKVIAEKFGWKASIEEPKVKSEIKTSFEKSQEDIIAGRINTYNNSEEMFKKLF